MQEKKYKVLNLGIEVTRRCNKVCPHCMRGDAQNITISEAMIDRIIEAVDDVKTVMIGNGEALLELDRVAYLIRKINESGWNTIYIEITTNGSVLDRRIIDAFESFCSNGHDRRIAVIRISNDQFHDKLEFERAYEYYCSAARLANNRIHQKGGQGRIIVAYTRKDNDREIRELAYEGRAVDYITNRQDERIFREGLNYPYLHSHRMCIVDSVVMCALQITANGDVTFLEGISYEHLDELAFGNIGMDRLVDIVDRHNANCMLLCNETDELREIDAHEQLTALNPKLVPYPVESERFRRMVLNRVLDLRYKAKAMYPNLSAQTIMEHLRFPKGASMSRNLFGDDKSVLDSIFGSITEGGNDNSKVMGCNSDQPIQDVEKDIEEYVAWKCLVSLSDIVSQNDTINDLTRVLNGAIAEGDVPEPINSLLPGLIEYMEKDGSAERVQMIARSRRSERYLREIKGSVEPALIHLQLIDTVIRYIKLHDGKMQVSDINSFRSADSHIGKMRLLYQGLTESDRQLYHDYIAAEHNTTWEALDERFTRYGLVSISHRDTQSDDELIRVIESLVGEGVEAGL